MNKVEVVGQKGWRGDHASRAVGVAAAESTETWLVAWESMSGVA